MAWRECVSCYPHGGSVEVGEGFLMRHAYDSDSDRRVVHVYTRQNSQWVHAATLVASDGFLTGRIAISGRNVLLSGPDKAYYYVQNEPQNEEDAALAAHLCRLTKEAAPNLKIAVSEEPTPAIAEDPGGACGYDIWIAHVRAYQQDYAWERQRDFGETVWFYSLDHDPDPWFNPTLVENDGMHSRIIPWAAWGHRITGWAYYDGGRFFSGPNPGIRAELLREGMEDYEYLWLANESAYPVPFEDAHADPTALSVASSMTSWTRNPDALMALRHELGLYIEGSRDTLPILSDEGGPGEHPRDSYYLNFQDPAGEPSADPLEVDGHTWIKIGWQPWSDEDGLGFYGENVEDPGIALYGYDQVDGWDPVRSSYVYDDYGRDYLFEFALENGRYMVTAAVGRPGAAYPGDPYNLVIEGDAIPVVRDGRLLRQHRTGLIGVPMERRLLETRPRTRRICRSRLWRPARRVCRSLVLGPLRVLAARLRPLRFDPG